MYTLQNPNVLEAATTSKSIPDTKKDLANDEPTYSRLIVEALQELERERKPGCGLASIFHRIKEKYNIPNERRAWLYMKLAMKHGLKAGRFRRIGKGIGMSGRFALGNGEKVNEEEVVKQEMVSSKLLPSTKVELKVVKKVLGFKIAYGRRQFLVRK